LKKEYTIRDEWLPFEIHPETPPEGVLLAERLSHIDWDDMYRNLRTSGARYDIAFGDVTLLSNSRLSLQAGEFARDQGRFEQFHEELFRAYFTDVEDIGSITVLLERGKKAGLDPAEMRTVLEENRYLPRLEAVTAEAHACGITSAPTFIINDRYSISGAQPLDVFRGALKEIESEQANKPAGRQ